MVDYKKDYGKRLRSAIKQSGLSQAALCRRTRILTQTMTGYLNGGIPRDIKDLESMARELHISIDWLLTGKEAKADIAEVGETPVQYGRPGYSDEEKTLVEEYRLADDKAREIGRMVFRMNPRDGKKKTKSRRGKAPR